MAPVTALPPQALTAAAQALIMAYNDRDWDQALAGLTSDFVYDEIASGRKVSGASRAVEAWKGWAQAFPDSRGTFNAAHVTEAGDVVLELTWRGTHYGPLQMRDGPVAPTGRTIEVRACAIVGMEGEKARIERHYFDMATLLRQIGIMP
ncbi:MAG TPA: ester cyclase [Gemmatimonadales bacterium]|nr:ester cyclase [Gemmatimonadales bacterium]